MKLATKIALVGAAAMIVAMAQPAQAACVDTFLLETPGAFYDAAGNPYYTSTVDDPVMTADAKGFFWALGAGDPDSLGDGSGPGIDNGVFDFQSAWRTGTNAYSYGDGTWFNYFASFLTNWAQPGIDGCVLDSADRGDRCTCVLLLDQDSLDGVGYFALLGVGDNQFDNYPFGTVGPVAMARMPRPQITGSSRNPSGRDVALNIVANVPSGVFVDGDCGGCGALTYKVFSQLVTQDPTGSSAPIDRAIDTGWSVLDNHAGTPVGQSVTLTAPCDTDEDLYLGVQLIADSGFATDIVGVNSTKVACDPNLADPETPRPINQNTRPDRPLSRKPTGRR